MAALGTSLLAPPVSAAPATPSASAAPTVTFMSSEEYQQRWGRAAETQPLSALPATVRTESGNTVSTTASTTTIRRPMDPGGGGGDASWWVILWDERDLAGTGTPVRFGDSSLGYYHYSGPHNLTTYKPIHAAFQTHKPDYASGAHLEYNSLVVNRQNAQIYLQVKVIVQAATRTDDGVYYTPDGKNIGVITAYCVNFDPCPGWVNSV
jgi:hypothetical protein